MKTKRAGKSKGGRPKKFNPKNCRLILNAVRLGVPITIAPLAAGVAYTTFRTWMGRGAKHKRGPYRDFVNAIARAEGVSIVRRFAQIEVAAQKGDWRAAQALLRLSKPRIFGNAAAKEEGDPNVPLIPPTQVTIEQKQIIVQLMDPGRLRTVIELADQLGLRDHLLGPLLQVPAEIPPVEVGKPTNGHTHGSQGQEEKAVTQVAPGPAGS